MHRPQFFTWTTHTAETTTLLEATRLQKLYTYMCNIVTEFYLYSIVYIYLINSRLDSGADPGFPIGGGANPRWRGHQPPTHLLFGENICKNERIWSCWGGGGARRKLLYVDPPL